MVRVERLRARPSPTARSSSASGSRLAQALVAAVVGAVLSFLLVGLVSIAGKRGSAPTLVLSRAAFGRFGNTLPGAVSYLLLVGWETVLVSLATFATATVFGRLGWGDGNLTKVVAFLVVAAVIVAAGILGFDAIMKLQKWLTIAMIVVTVALHRADLRPRRRCRRPPTCRPAAFSAVARRHRSW